MDQDWQGVTDAAMRFQEQAQKWAELKPAELQERMDDPAHPWWLFRGLQESTGQGMLVWLRVEDIDKALREMLERLPESIEGQVVAAFTTWARNRAEKALAGLSSEEREKRIAGAKEMAMASLDAVGSPRQ